MAEEQAPVFNIEKIYVRDLSIEVPNAPQVFLERESPKIDIQLSTKANPINDAHYEVVLSVTATATFPPKLPDGKTEAKSVFLVEAHQAGVFQIRNIPKENIEQVLAIHCPNILFPYVRETISDAVSRAGFPSFFLAPVNFEAIHQARLQAQAQQASPTQH
ncbi:MAG: protein-export chaperone SecB [Betaproteobacteria bacterium]|nr:protein-export chaperone SecB [Betaproteobacteria bacterium]